MTRLRRLTWRYPEWWALGVSALAWWAVLHRPHAHSSSSGLTAGLSAWLGPWTLMVLAMMLPLVLDSIRSTALRSLWKRRLRAMLGFAAGYLTAWVLFGLALGLVCQGLHSGLLAGNRHAAALAFAIASVWQWTHFRRRAARACHRTAPLSPSGWRADRDCLLFGWTTGGHCLLSCGALMLACGLAGHRPETMLIGSALGLADRYAWRPNQSVISCGILILALIQIAMP